MRKVVREVNNISRNLCLWKRQITVFEVLEIVCVEDLDAQSEVEELISVVPGRRLITASSYLQITTIFTSDSAAQDLKWWFEALLC